MKDKILPSELIFCLLRSQNEFVKEIKILSADDFIDIQEDSIVLYCLELRTNENLYLIKCYLQIDSRLTNFLNPLYRSGSYDLDIYLIENGENQGSFEICSELASCQGRFSQDLPIGDFIFTWKDEEEKIVMTYDGGNLRKITFNVPQEIKLWSREEIIYCEEISFSQFEKQTFLYTDLDIYYLQSSSEGIEIHDPDNKLIEIWSGKNIFLWKGIEIVQQFSEDRGYCQKKFHLLENEVRFYHPSGILYRLDNLKGQIIWSNPCPFYSLCFTSLEFKKNETIMVLMSENLCNTLNSLLQGEVNVFVIPSQEEISPRGPTRSIRFEIYNPKYRLVIESKFGNKKPVYNQIIYQKKIG